MWTFLFFANGWEYWKDLRGVILRKTQKQIEIVKGPPKKPHRRVKPLILFTKKCLRCRNNFQTENKNFFLCQTCREDS